MSGEPCCYCQKPVGAEAYRVHNSLSGWAHPVCFWRAHALEFERKMDRLMEHNPVYVATRESLGVATHRLKVKDDALRLTQRNVEGTHDGGYVIRVTGAEMGAIRCAIDRVPAPDAGAPWCHTCGGQHGPDGPDCLASLPPGQTCAYCAFYASWCAMFGAEPGNVRCDFFPSRFAFFAPSVKECTCGVAGHLKGVDPSNTCQTCGGHVRGLDRYYPGEQPPPAAKEGSLGG